MSRILLALQYWAGDRDKAGELARFIAKLEPVIRKDADFLLSARFDCTHDEEVVKDVSRRFRVFTTTGVTKLTGYPNGSWALWHDTITAVRDRCASGELPRYDCVLTFEADCTPLTRDWVASLLSTWEREAAKQDRIAIGQLWSAPSCPYPHINGNMLISGRQEHLDRVCSWRAKTGQAWDVGIYPMLRGHGAVGTSAIASFYVRNANSRWFDYTRGQGAVFFHGDKDGSATRYAQHVLRGGPKPPVVAGKFAPPGKGFEDFAVSEGPSEAGIWRYPDEVPSVFEQGFSGMKPLFAHEDHRRFNPGLEVHNGNLLMAYRMIHRYTDESGIRVAKLGPDRKVLSDEPVTGLPQWADGRVSYYEDPRLFWWGDRLMLAYTHAAYFPHAICNQALIEIDPDTYEARVPVDLSHIGANTSKVGSLEKNWQFFVDGTERLNAVYTLAPHLVYNVRDQRRFFSNITPVSNWQEKWGVARGGTPPVRVGDRWFSFFHSSQKHPTRRRRYVAGCYSFKWDGSLFLAKDCTRDPLWIASTQDGFLWPAGACNWEPAVVFPGGAVFDASRQVWTVAAGINDCFSALFEVPHSQLLAKF